jgi:hypothetical protein
MNPKSTCSATAKWDHKPKDTTSGWLTFSKKEKIIHIGFPYLDYWCWSGMNAKGKWGLFPKDFVDGVTDIGVGGESIWGAGIARMNYLPELVTGNITGSVNRDELSSATSATSAASALRGSHEGIPGSRESSVSHTNSPSPVHSRFLSSTQSHSPSISSAQPTLLRSTSRQSNSSAGTPTEQQEPTQGGTHKRSSSTSSCKIGGSTSDSSSSFSRRPGVAGGGYPSSSDSGVTLLKRGEDSLLNYI